MLWPSSVFRVEQFSNSFIGGEAFQRPQGKKNLTGIYFFLPSFSPKQRQNDAVREAGKATDYIGNDGHGQHVENSGTNHTESFHANST